ncbi:hypothetical protein [Flammeovirga aprica]|uniref:Uncharacterized protein n=1 Tax=Flammeovirga aprica JL-4 TaxID=694437 RepID=A0A7X9S1H8_9BACT|nr:hypothetical protein [Flammeovirga aprica]NME72534.1 hypothetical protein [Flammeovirga aprica JL-4]
MENIKSKHAVASLQNFKIRLGDVEPNTKEFRKQVYKVLSWVFTTEYGTADLDIVNHFTNKLCNDYGGDIFELYLSFDSTHEKRFVDFLL